MNGEKDMDHRVTEPANAVIGHPAAEDAAPDAGCGCIERVNAAMFDRNTKIVLPWFGLQQPFVETMKVDDKRRGKACKLFASHCPFCGVRYPEPSKDSPIT